MQENNTAEKQLTNENFVRAIISQDLAENKNNGRVHTRFPPEPNGYLHIGHAKSICLNFGLAREFQGQCNLRFDDTNPEKEETEYVDSIMEDVRWLGFSWDNLCYSSDYFDQLYELAEKLIEKGLAYVDSQSADEIRATRGTLTEPGHNSPFRERSVAENLELFRQMKAGAFDDGAHVLRAKIDMASPNIVMRDPVIYRIRKVSHHRSGDRWNVYPMYDFAHCLSDSIENITHSICTLEFENNRALYHWVLDALELASHPCQYEFARLNMTYTLLSKRKLLRLVTHGHVSGWDDPRMPTISGLRRRGYTPAALRDFCDRIGVARADSTVDVALLEHCLREDLNAHAPRYMAVLDPLKVVIQNYPQDQEEEFVFPNYPDKEEMGLRTVPFAREIFIDRADFMEDPPKKFFRLAVGREVRLRYAYYITCQSVIKDEQGRVVELRCTYAPMTRGGWSEDGRKVKGTLHWVPAAASIGAEVRLYDRLFKDENPGAAAEENLAEALNPDSLKINTEARLERALVKVPPEALFSLSGLGIFARTARNINRNIRFLTVLLVCVTAGPGYSAIRPTRLIDKKRAQWQQQ